MYKPSPKYWPISAETGQFLNLLIRDRNIKSVLEIGSGSGYSGIWMAKALKHIKGHLYTIESHKKERYPLACANFKKSGLSKFITPILGHAPEDIPSTPRNFDMAFFDATKHEHSSYFDVLKTRCPLILVDNVLSHKDAFKPFLQALKKAKWTHVILNIGSGLLVAQR